MKCSQTIWLKYWECFIPDAGFPVKIYKAIDVKGNPFGLQYIIIARFPRAWEVHHAVRLLELNTQHMLIFMYNLKHKQQCFIGI